MKNALTIARRELGAYFNGPIAYIVITVYLLVSGFLFFNQLFLGGQAEMRDFFGIAPLILIFFAPAITMRLLAEEKGSGTLEMLITMPLRDFEVVLGKFLAAVGLFAVALLLTGAWAVSVAWLGPLDAGPTIGGYLGLLLLGSTYLAVGVMASSLTRNQIVAFILAFAICFALFLFGKVIPFLPDALKGVVQYLSLDSHFQNVSRGVLDSRDLVYYGSLIAACLFIATQSLESRKWR